MKHVNWMVMLVFSLSLAEHRGGSLALAQPSPAVPPAQPAARPAPPAQAAAADADDPSARQRAIRAWFGKPPTAAQKAERKRRVQAERKSVAASRGVQGAPTSNVGVWTNLGPTGQFTDDRSDIDAGRLSGVAVIGTNVYVSTPGGGVFRASNVRISDGGSWAWQSITDSLDTSSSRGGVAVGAMLAATGGRDMLIIGTGDSRDSSAGGEVYVTPNASGSTPMWSGVTLDGASFVQALGMVSTATTTGGTTTYDDTLLVGTEHGLFVGKRGSSLSRSSTIGDREIWSIQTDQSSNAVVSTLGTNATIYYSTNKGSTWTKATLDDSAKQQQPQRISLVMSPTDSSKVWGIAASTSGNLLTGVLVSTDGGKTWSYQSTSGMSDGLQFADSNQMLTVSPDGSTLFFGSGGAVYRSTDGGVTATQIADDERKDGPYLHTDLHAATWWAGSSAGISKPWALLVGSDGGLGIFLDPFRASVPDSEDVTFLDNHRNENLPILQAYNLASTQASGATSLVGAGAQDNGTRLRAVASGGQLAQSGIFAEVGSCGDGMGTLLHPSNGNLMLAACDAVTIYKTTDAQDASPDFDRAQSGIDGAGDDSKAVFFTKLIPDAHDGTGNTVYTFVRKKIYKSTSYGDSWTALAMSGFDSSNDLRNLAVAASNGSTLALVAEADRVYTSTDGGASWSRSTANRAGSSGELSAVWIDSKDDKTLYVASVANDPSKSHLWKSTNRGKSWTAIDRKSNGKSNGFPQGFAVHMIQNNPQSSSDLFAGTDLGVYRSTDGGATWARYGRGAAAGSLGLPMVAVTDLYLAPDGSFLRAATFGRGLWEVALK